MRATTLLVAICFLAFFASSVSAYPDEHLPHGNTTVLATCQTKRFIHVFARGKDGQLWHRYTDNTVGPQWSGWLLRAKAVNGSTFDSDPACGVNADGTVEVFIRFHDNLDIWQSYQTDPNLPESWSDMREAACLDLTPGNCLTPASDFYWNRQPIFPTSNVQVLNNPVDGSIQLFYRGFDGGYYVTTQVTPGSHQYGPPARFQNLILE